MTVGELRVRMDRSELADWQALTRLEHEERETRDADRRARDKLAEVESRARRER